MRKLFLTSVAALFLAGVAQGQDRFADTVIKSQHVAGSAHMLTGSGGNIGVSAGEDGILIVDDQFEPLAERIAAAIDGIKKGKVNYVINTHYHGDHTGSNAWFREAHKSTIFAHDNVRKRLASKKEHKHAALPVVTYSHDIHFHFNGETIQVVPLSGHTDGDSAVWFKQANVLHAGDLFFQGRFPYIDLKGGGNVAKYMASVQKLIDMSDSKTQIIPGHGKLSSKQDYQDFLNMIKETAGFVAKQKAAGKSVEEVLKKGLADKWKSWSWQFINEEFWIKTLYEGQ